MNLLKIVSLLLLALAIHKVNVAQNTFPWPTTGNIGIGTTSPDYLLTVNGPSHLASDVILTRTDGFSGGASIVVDNVLTKILSLQKIGGGNIDYINLLGTSIGLNGSVAVGATFPQFKLDVFTTAANDGMRITHNSSGAILFQANSLTGGAWNSITKNGDAGIIYQSLTQPTNFGFVIAPWANAMTGIRVDNNGNVGICTNDTKNYQLAVNGSAIFTKAVVKLYPNWPDYVFKPDYHLPSLDSVAKFIKANNHLPEIPSADSVAKNGLDLGGNQAALLKKIEELTLYAIEQQRQLEELRKENKKMGERLNGLEATHKK